MIEELRVHGIGGIKDAHLSFGGNFIVITGESGTGKSSLVRALEFITGKRAQSAHIHALEDESDVTAVIEAAHIDGAPEECQPQEGSLIARRTFSRAGRGRCTLQGEPVPLSILSAVMDKEVVIQSQFAQLGLLDQSKQLELVDSCGGAELLLTRAQLASAFESAMASERAILELKKKRVETEERFKDADAVLGRIKSLELEDDSDIKWEKELTTLEANAAKAASLSELTNSLTGGASGTGMLGGLENLCAAVYAAVPQGEPQWREYCEKMLTSAQQLTSALQARARELSDGGDMDEAQDRLEKKIGMVRKLKRTLNLADCSALKKYAEDAENGLKWLAESREELAEEEEKSSALRKKVSSLAMELRTMRKAAAKVLADRVNGQLRDLAMEYADFEIEIDELDRVRANGAEGAQFMLRLPDQTPLPVGKTASGGELSRIMIAMQLSLGDEKLPGTIVFDEVEAGLGGKTALLAGYKLKELSRRCRTVLITHEATIAAMADRHYLVRRNGDETYITEISGEEREREIARMLAGDEKSPEALEHARSLLDGK